MKDPNRSQGSIAPARKRSRVAAKPSTIVVVCLSMLVSDSTTTLAFAARSDQSHKKVSITAPRRMIGKLSTSNEALPRCCAQIIREALRDDFPEIDLLCSDAYLESVASVPGRTLDYAIQQKIKGSLEWRRSFGVDTLRKNFVHIPAADDEKENDDMGGIFVPVMNQKPCVDSASDSEFENESDQEDRTESDWDESYDEYGSDVDGSSSENLDEDDTGNCLAFVPSEELVEVCASGAFVVRGEELIENHDAGLRGRKRRLVVYADTSRMNWWQTGVEAGLQYHVLVLEQALERIRLESHHPNSDLPLSESLVVFVDTRAAPLLPPPLSVPRGMVNLMQKAYPDRIHRIYVGPVNPILRKLYEYLVPFLRPRSKKKIVLMAEPPSVASIAFYP